MELRARGIGIVEGEIEHLVVDDDRLRAVHISDGPVMAREALFVLFSDPDVRSHQMM